MSENWGPKENKVIRPFHDGIDFVVLEQGDSSISYDALDSTSHGKTFDGDMFHAHASFPNDI